MSGIATTQRAKPAIAKTRRLTWTVFALAVCLMASILMAACGSGNADGFQQITDATEPKPMLSWFLAAGILVALVALFVLAINQSSHGEVVAGIFIVILLLFYYTQPVHEWASDLEYRIPESDFPNKLLAGVSHLVEKPLDALVSAQAFVLDHLPQKTISIGEFSLLQLSTKNSFETTLVPIVFLILGVAIRIGVARYVRNERLRELTGEYWLYVLAYVVLAYVISAITNWSFLAVIGLFLLIFVALALGVLRVGGDVLKALLHLLILLQKTARIMAKSIVSLVTVIADFLKSIGQWIKRLYETYIVDPIVAVYEAVASFLEEIEEGLDDFLNRRPR